MRRRVFIKAIGSAIAWSFAARAQQPAMPVIGFVRDGSAEGNTRNAAGFRKGLNETGYVEGQNVTIEYHWLEGNYDSLPALFADLVRRKVALIATPGTVPTRAAKAATSDIPIVFGVGEDPVQLGLVASIARPGGNATGINFQTSEVAAKRLLFLHDMLPKAGRIAVLVNPRNTLPSPPCGTCRKQPPQWDCTSRYSTPQRSEKSMRLLPQLFGSAPMPSSLRPTHFSAAAARNL